MGAGKTTVGSALAARLGWRFLDADDFHDEATWAKLERGDALGDADRLPWLGRVRDALEAAVARQESAVLACSALKQSYRDTLIPSNADPADVRFVYLDADRALTAARLIGREGHRAAASLLDSQYAALEEPRDALRVSTRRPVAEIVQHIVDALGLDGGGSPQE